MVSKFGIYSTTVCVETLNLPVKSWPQGYLRGTTPIGESLFQYMRQGLWREVILLLDQLRVGVISAIHGDCQQGSQLMPVVMMASAE